jgi:DNA-binding beta-propeller fold protein YncE
VANERGHHLQVYNYPTTQTGSPTYVRQIGLIGSDDTDPGHFRWPVDIEFYTRTDGTRVAVIGDRMASSVKIFNANTYEELLMIPNSPNSNHGTAVDPATGNIYVNNGGSDRIDVYDQAGVKLFQFGTSGTADGQFRDPVDSVISDGVLYVVDEANSRVQAFDLTGVYLGKWGGTFGGAPYELRNPVGIDADTQGRLYITDAGNDRIVVYDPAQARTTSRWATSSCRSRTCRPVCGGTHRTRRGRRR